MQRITTFLWFDHEAEEAAKFYVSIFKHSKIKKVARYGDSGPGPKGSVMTVEFKLDGQEFMAINGGPTYKLTPAISLVVNCKTQKEVDTYWKKLSKGGQEVQCGWLTDKFGLSWQVTPTILTELIASKNAAKANRVMEAMMKMVKIDIKAIKDAAANKGGKTGGKRLRAAA